jgi:flavin reductase (DIM6/NTAB) family NADH-FMN oxidoreductase RutF
MMPSGLYLLGSRQGEIRNLMTANWVTQLSSVPKLLGVSVEHEALTHQLIEESGQFALSIISQQDRAVIRKFVKPALFDREAMTLNGVAYLEARSTGLPVLASALGYFECRVTDTLHFDSHTLFVGEVIDVELGEVSPGDHDVEVLSMGDTRMNYGG